MKKAVLDYCINVDNGFSLNLRLADEAHVTQMMDTKRKKMVVNDCSGFMAANDGRFTQAQERCA